jgi:hypothetical protein
MLDADVTASLDFVSMNEIRGTAIRFKFCNKPMTSVAESNLFPITTLIQENYHNFDMTRVEFFEALSSPTSFEHTTRSRWPRSVKMPRMLRRPRSNSYRLTMHAKSNSSDSISYYGMNRETLRPYGMSTSLHCQRLNDVSPCRPVRASWPKFGRSIRGNATRPITGLVSRGLSAECSSRTHRETRTLRLLSSSIRWSKSFNSRTSAMPSWMLLTGLYEELIFQ